MDMWKKELLIRFVTANGSPCEHHAQATMTPARALMLCACALALVVTSAWWSFSDNRPRRLNPPTEVMTGSWVPQAGDETGDEPSRAPSAAPAEMQIAKLIAHIRTDSSQAELSLSDGRTLTVAVTSNQPGLLVFNVPLSKGWAQISLSVRQDGDPALVTDGTCSRLFVRAP